jgi:hypothetical protein
MADQIFSAAPQMHFYLTAMGSYSCEFTSNDHPFFYNDIAYFKTGGIDKVLLMGHLNAGLSAAVIQMTLYTYYGLLDHSYQIIDSNQNYSNKMAFSGGPLGSGAGIITYIRNSPGNNWDVYSLRTLDGGNSWTSNPVDQSTNRARWCDVISVRNQDNSFKVGYIQDNQNQPSGYYTGNNGNNWNSPAPLIINNQSIDTAHTKVRAGYAFIGTDNCLALWTSSQTNSTFASRLCLTTTGVNNNNEIPGKFSLSQNYPNPFNPSTTIKFSVPFSGSLKLTVYNVLGETVAALVNGHKEAGNYSINFDASGLGSGVYFYKIEFRQAGSPIGDFSDVKKMVLIK